MLRTDTDTPATTHAQHDAALGVAYALAAYVAWAVIAAYFKLLSHVPPLLVLAHRVVWSFAFLAVVVAFTSKWREVRGCLANKKVVALLACSTVLLAVNWGVFIWAVANNRVLQASIGYFILPLVSVAMGVIFLKERLRRLQVVSFALAAIGVIVLTFTRGQLPWVGLALALSFGGYGLIRKIARVGPLEGVLVETALLLPVALAFIIWTRSRGDHIQFDGRTYGLLVLAGVVTAMPLLWFTAAARRLRLTTIGFLQYLTPTGQFLLAVFAYHETFGASALAGFAFIWTALAIFSVNSLLAYRDTSRPAFPVAIEP